MKKIMIITLLIMGILFTGSSWAATITIDRVTGYYSGNGGEFNIAGFGAATNSLYAPKALVNQGFESFCLETDEDVNTPGTYNAVINPDHQAFGGGSNTNSGDTISRGTAWLYSQFSQGTLSGYDYTAGSKRRISAAALQQTIWWLEDEYGIGLPVTFQTLLINEFGSLDNAKLDIDQDQDYGVGVLNLTTLSGGPAQDQLVRTPVPEPTTLLFLGAGLFGLGFAVRRREN